MHANVKNLKAHQETDAQGKHPFFQEQMTTLETADKESFPQTVTFKQISEGGEKLAMPLSRKTFQAMENLGQRYRRRIISTLFKEQPIGLTGSRDRLESVRGGKREKVIEGEKKREGEKSSMVQFTLQMTAMAKADTGVRISDA